MENITIKNINCIFLNHHKLIQDLYQQHVDSNFTLYSLKQEIFNFKPKIANFSLEGVLKSKQLKRLKKNRQTETEKRATIEEKNFHLDLFIKEIQEKLQLLPPTNEDVPRLWEEQYDLPQFRGANPTNKFQQIKFFTQDYIIPPKTRFFNYNIKNLSELLPELETYDLLVVDMPWQNKYIKRLRKVKSSLSYSMLDNETLKNMPISQLMHKNSLVALWCTNALQHRKAIEEEFLSNWNLQLVHCLKWFKINTAGKLISPPKPEGYKQPYELLYIACSNQRKLLDFKDLTKVDFLISIPSIIHSHKPPIAEWLKKFLTNGEHFKGLEIFARYLQPQFTSIGLEVLKLMNTRLYNVTHNSANDLIENKQFL